MKHYTSYDSDNGKTIEDIKTFIDSKNIDFVSTKTKNNYHELGSYESVEVYANYISEDDYQFDDISEEEQIKEDQKLSVLHELESEIQKYIYGQQLANIRLRY